MFVFKKLVDCIHPDIHEISFEIETKELREEKLLKKSKK